MVVLQGVSASIAGGDRELGEDAPVLLDASGSQDNDAFPEVPFFFAWSCVTVSGLSPTAAAAAVASGSPGCVDRAGAPLTSYPSLARSSTPLLELPRGTMLAGTYVFIVNASKGSPRGLIPFHFRSSLAAVTLTVLAGSPPAVYTLAAVGSSAAALDGVWSGAATVSKQVR